MNPEDEGLGGFKFERFRSLFEELLAEQDQEKRREEARRQVEPIKKEFYANSQAREEEYEKGTSNLVSRTLKALVELKDFADICLEFHSIPDLLHKKGYVDRIIYERLTDYAQVMGGPVSDTLFHYRLREIGLPLLCPYLKLEDANRYTHQDCTIDCVNEGDEITMALCGGRYDSCVVFKNRMERAVQGLIRIRLPEVRTSKQIHQECLVDLDDLDNWWQGEGIYE